MEKVANRLKKVVAVSTSNPSKALTFEVAKFAKLADGACTSSMGDTSVLVTAVSEKPKNPDTFVPLSVEYRQKAAAAGRIPMTHLRRDIGVTEREILINRMIDRSIRPSFAKGFNLDTQVICNLLAVDGVNDPDILAINGASASLSLSDIPWNGPIAAVRMGLIGELPIVNPSRRERENSRLNFVISANQSGNIVMLDGSCEEPVLVTDAQKVIKQGIKECQSIVGAISKLQAACGKPKRTIDLSHLPTNEHKDYMMLLSQAKITEVLKNHNHDKFTRDDAMKAVREEVAIAMKEKFPDIESYTISESFIYAFRRVYKQILDETRLRCDGRKFSDIRPITCSVNLYKPLHGSSLFQRGQTQVFCSTTFDSPDAAFRTDSLTSLVSGVKEKNFMLHYEFPPYATNEVGRVGTMPNRREIGHGALAEKAIRPLVPENHDMTIRLNCEVLESNGSSSMASVCAGSLSLMDAGLGIKEHVAGVAMGIIGTELESNMTVDEMSENLILTDILGLEDFLGDMDFKIAGTRKALTAVQLDVKPMNGMHPQIVYKTLQKSHVARSEIIGKMEKAIKEPRKMKKDNHPVIKTIYIPPHKVAKFIGFGGSNLKKLMAKTGVRISSHGDSSDTPNMHDGLAETQISGGRVQDNYIIFAPNKDAMQEAEDYIKICIEDRGEPKFEFNAIYTVTVEEIRENGVMITMHPKMSPVLLPLSQLDARQVRHPSALGLKVGDQIQVKYFGRDPTTGQMRVSRKSLMLTSNAPAYHRSPLGT